jgi:hypothetical protein
MVTDQFRRLMVQLPEPASSPVRWGIAINCLAHEMAAIAELGLGPSEFDAHVAELVEFVVTGLGGDQ